ncbi:MAG: AzlC family ABC transporter permease [Bacillota bacterium]|nr:AzlC family ABC transporter permease [Bacillota bacterium]
MDFKRGTKDGIPIALGYFSVSIAFGLMAVEAGCTWFEALLISVTNLTSAGQFAGITVIAGMGTYLEMALTQFVINSRYALMAVSLSQKVDEKFKGIWRWLLGFAITDELFAVAIGHEGEVSRSYFSGLIGLPILGWSAGTVVGAILGNVMPEIVTSALGIALYGMFIAVVVPKARENLHVLATVLIAILLSVILYYVPVFSGISAGFAIIICAVIASAIGAILFPIRENPETLPEDEPASAEHDGKEGA